MQVASEGDGMGPEQVAYWRVPPSIAAAQTEQLSGFPAPPNNFQDPTVWSGDHVLNGGKSSLMIPFRRSFPAGDSATKRTGRRSLEVAPWQGTRPGQRRTLPCMLTTCSAGVTKFLMSRFCPRFRTCALSGPGQLLTWRCGRSTTK